MSLIQSYLEKVTEQKMDFDFPRSQKIASTLSTTYPLPQSIVVGGTNGKGSTVAFLSQILQAHGLSVGTFTSPHLLSIFERIKINQELISNRDFEEFGEQIVSLMNQLDLQLTYFETLTFLAWMYFSKHKPDICLWEVGLGGRLDTTNTVKRIGSVLTRIDLDHTQILGDTLDKIAIEKAPILQPKIFNVIARQETQAQNVLSKWTKGFDAVDVEGKDFFHSGTFDTFTFENENFYLPPTTLGLLGQHQSTNAALAIQAASHVLDLKGKTLECEKTKNALSQTRLMGRMETWKKKNQTVIVDVAHNPAGIDALISYLYTKDPKQRYHIIFGCSNDKNASSMIQRLEKIAHNIVCTSFAHPRSWNANSYAETWFENVETAFCATWESATQPVIAAGSIFYIAELIPVLQKYGFEKV